MRSHGLPAGLERLEQECEKHGVTNGGKLREDVPCVAREATAAAAGIAPV